MRWKLRSESLNIVITLQQIDETIQWEGLKKFGRFVLSYSVEGSLPDYTKIDLMQIPHLVPNIWVYDLRNEEKKRALLMSFAGEEHTKLHGRNVCGESDTKIFQEQGLSDYVVEHFRKSIDEKSTAYSKLYRKYTFEDGKMTWRYVESLFFPCSSDGKNINWGVGCVIYELKNFKNENIYLYF